MNKQLADLLFDLTKNGYFVEFRLPLLEGSNMLVQMTHFPSSTRVSYIIEKSTFDDISTNNDELLYMVLEHLKNMLDEDQEVKA